jgi:hypothetical protein
MKYRKVKQVLFDSAASGKGRAKEKGKVGKLSQMCYIFMYENRSMKSAETLLRRGGKGERWRG